MSTNGFHNFQLSFCEGNPKWSFCLLLWNHMDWRKYFVVLLMKSCVIVQNVRYRWCCLTPPPPPRRDMAALGSIYLNGNVFFPPSLPKLFFWQITFSCPRKIGITVRKVFVILGMELACISRLENKKLRYISLLCSPGPSKHCRPTPWKFRAFHEGLK